MSARSSCDSELELSRDRWLERFYEYAFDHPKRTQASPILLSGKSVREIALFRESSGKRPHVKNQPLNREQLTVDIHRQRLIRLPNHVSITSPSSFPAYVCVYVSTRSRLVFHITVQELLHAKRLQGSRTVHFATEMVVFVVLSNLLVWR